MNNLRKQLGKNPLIKQLASIKITIVCLSLLFILTFWGTIAQVENGLYGSQEKYFFSWIFLTLGFLPFPGARLVLWVMFINLVCVAIVRFVYKWSHVGITIIHIGLLLFFLAAFVTFHGAQDSNITLGEGQGLNLSSAYHNWEISIWEDTNSNQREVLAFDSDHFSEGQIIDADKIGLKLEVISYFVNSDAFLQSSGQKRNAFNSSGIQALQSAPLEKEPEKNIPGVILNVKAEDIKDLSLILYGGETKPTQIQTGGKTYNFILRRKRFEMPFVIKLKDFRAEFHPNTEIARSFQSLVEVITKGSSREVLISMNEPLRYKNYTFYQASYAIDNLGREFSTLAVVKNAGRLLPYIASFVVFAGLLIHFLMMAFNREK